MSENEQESLLARVQRSRRNFLVMGGIATSALLAMVATARSEDEHENEHEGGHKCFLKGTTIDTAGGKRKVENLTIGDLLPTVFGGMRPVQWIGRYRYKKSDPQRPWVKDARPVRIARSALAPNVPDADLYVTPAHKLLIDGALVPAGDLINGTTITHYASDEYAQLEFFHIKLETHDVVYAEGAACETVLSVDEAASNIIEHAYHGRADQRIQFDAEAFPDHLGIRLHHLGDPFDPSMTAPPAFDGSRESGFGDSGRVGGRGRRGPAAAHRR